MKQRRKLEIDPGWCGKQIYDSDSNAYRWIKDGTGNKWCRDN